MTIKNKHLMPNERYVMIRALGDKLAIIKSMGQHEMFVTTDIMQEILAMLKEQEKRINELEGKLRLLQYGDQDTLQSGLMPAT